MKSLTTEEFIKRSKAKFKNKYIYNKTFYKNTLTRLIITCDKHGDVSILPNTHLSGCGCSFCSRDLNGKSHKYNTEEFVEKARSVHGLKYDYNLTKYEHSLKKVIINCSAHGSFKIKPSNHINNKQGCWHCGKESTGSLQKKTLYEFIEQIKKKPNFEKYDFNFIKDFKNNKELVTIICNIHGKYQRSITDILKSKYFGCKKCKIKDDTFTKDIFIEKSKIFHNDNYSYEKSNYSNTHKSVIITCKKHGDFSAMPYTHMSGKGFCPKCTDFVSSYEIELEKFILNEIPEIKLETSCRSFKGIKEIDIVCHLKKIAIEFNGLYWHCDIFKDKNYHLNKTLMMNNMGYRLIHIFEDEWLNKKDICKSIIMNIFGKNTKKIYARKCAIKEISNKESKEFLNENHIQGYCTSKQQLGLFENKKLVSVMTFRKNRSSSPAGSKNYEFELLRFCCLKYTSVIGAASKLFGYFVKLNSPNKITNYGDP